MNAVSLPSSAPVKPISAEEKVEVSKALTILNMILKNRGASAPSDFGINVVSADRVLSDISRLLREDEKVRISGIAIGVCSKVEAALKTSLDKRAKAIGAFNALDADLRAELGVSPGSTVSILVSDLLGCFPSGWTVQAAAKLLHDSGFLVHSKEDLRKKEQTPPYLTATVGKPIRTSK